MAVGLLAVGVLMAPGPVAALPLPIAAIGTGIGACWAFIAQRVMSGAKPGEESIAASSVPTVQQAGIAFGAAVSGLVANGSRPFGPDACRCRSSRRFLGAGGLRRGTARRRRHWYSVECAGVAVGPRALVR